MQSRAKEWMARAYECCLKCWEEKEREETIDFQVAISFYVLYPFFCNEMLRLLRLAAGVSQKTLSRLEAKQGALASDNLALVNASEVWKAMLESGQWWQTAVRVSSTIQDDRTTSQSLNSAPIDRPISKAPPPLNVLRGNGGWSQPKPNEVPTDFPPEFPPTLTLRMRIIIAECVKAVPDRSALDRLCKEIVSRSTELLCSAVRQGILTAYDAPDRLNDVLHYVRVANCGNGDERYRVEKVVANSDEWLALLTRLADCEAEAQPKESELKNRNVTDRKKKIEAFIKSLQDYGQPITKKDIWRVAGYADPTEFERFQRGDERTTHASEVNFTRILNTSPEAFLAFLKKMDRR